MHDCCGLWRREAMQCTTLYWLGGRPSCLECLRAKICTELKSVSKPEKIQHCYENWPSPSQCSSRTDVHADHEEASRLPQTSKTLLNNRRSTWPTRVRNKENPAWPRPSSSLPLPPSFMFTMARGGMASRSFVWAAHGGILCTQLGLRSRATKETTPAVT
jgi:hypothetical protein